MTKRENISNEIQGKLGKLKSALRLRLIVEAVALLLIAVVAAVFVTLAFDYTLHLERPLRVVMMAAVLGALGWIVWRQLFVPLSVSMPTDELALLVERRHQSLGDRLISAIQFSRGASPAESPEMIRQVMIEAEEMAQPLDLSDIVEHRRMWKMGGLSLLTLLILGAFSTLCSGTISMWAQRNLKFAEVDWPQDTYLKVEGGPDFAVLREGEFKLTVTMDPDRFSAETPEKIIVHVEYPIYGWTEDQIKRTDRENDDGKIEPVFEKVFSPVSEEFRFYVTGGDDKLDKRRIHNVTLIDPPDLNNLQFVVEYPAYMKRSPRSVDGSRGVLTVPEGSFLQVTAQATKDLKFAEIVRDGKVVDTVKPTEDGDGRPRLLRTRVKMDLPELTDEEKVKNKGKPRPIVLQFALTDSDDWTNSGGQKYIVDIQKDRSPSVDVRKRIVRSLVSPNAIVPLVIRPKDDCGIKTVSVTVTLKPKADGQTKTLKDNVRKIRISAPGRTEMRLDHELDLATMGLAPDDEIEIVVEVGDTLPPDMGGPNKTKSAPITLRITEPSELMKNLIERQKSLRLEFVQALALQSSALNKTVAAGRTLAKGSVTADVRRKLSESRRSQTGVGSECAKGAAAFQIILNEMEYNRLGTPEDRQRISDDIIDPIRQLADPIEKTTARLNDIDDELAESLKKTGADVDPLRKQVEQVAEVQQKIYDDMKSILGEIIKSETRQDMINSLRAILGWSEDQERRIQRIIDRQKGGIFDDDSSGEKDKDEKKTRTNNMGGSLPARGTVGEE